VINASRYIRRTSPVDESMVKASSCTT
jgi:hypothetical protein